MKYIGAFTVASVAVAAAGYITIVVAAHFVENALAAVGEGR